MYISITGQKNNMLDDQDHFNVLREINKSNKSTQRQLADKLGFSLGKLNYCIKALKKKGLVKISNFEKNPNKFFLVHLIEFIHIRENFTQFHLFFSFFSCFWVILGP